MLSHAEGSKTLQIVSAFTALYALYLVGPFRQLSHAVARRSDATKSEKDTV